MPKRILVIDSNTETRRRIETALKNAGYAVAVAVDSYVAFECACKYAFDLLALDDRMPIIDGINLLSLLRDHGRDVAALLMARDGHSLESLKEMGVKAVLTQPVRVDEVVVKVGEILSD